MTLISLLLYIHPSAIQGFIIARRQRFRAWDLEGQGMTRDDAASMSNLSPLNSQYDKTSQLAKLYEIGQVTFFITRKILKRMYLHKKNHSLPFQEG